MACLDFNKRAYAMNTGTRVVLAVVTVIFLVFGDCGFDGPLVITLQSAKVDPDFSAIYILTLFLHKPETNR
jgi:hypothetical protein